MAYKHLTFTDRLRIEAWERSRTPVSVMARELGVARSTVYRELKRGRYVRMKTDLTTEEHYSPDIAQKRHDEHMRNKGPDLKIGKDHELATFLEFMIAKQRYSPQAALMEIDRKEMNFSVTLTKQTVYRYIDDGVFLSLSNKDLPIKGKKHPHHKRIRRASRPPKGKSIEERPPEVEGRETFGHWEMDCVVGKQGTRPALLVLTERYSRLEIIRKLPAKTAQAVVKALDHLELAMGTETFRQVFQTITVDNGSEFMDVSGIEKNRTDLFFCHPYSSWERGSNENQNKLIRRHYPKGTDFRKVTKAEVRRLEEWVNDYPRAIFNGYSAKDVYLTALDTVTA